MHSVGLQVNIQKKTLKIKIKTATMTTTAMVAMTMATTTNWRVRRRLKPRAAIPHTWTSFGSKQTAAGFPWKGVSVKASTSKIGTCSCEGHTAGVEAETWPETEVTVERETEEGAERRGKASMFVLITVGPLAILIANVLVIVIFADHMVLLAATRIAIVFAIYFLILLRKMSE